MRYVSEQFKEKLNQVIRPPLKMWFEVVTDVNQRWLTYGEQNFEDFDKNVAPVINPSVCTNEMYYAVVGDGKGVDDPNRICAAVKSGGTFPTPTHTVPFGVTKVASANEVVLIGSNSNSNYLYGGMSPFVIAFTGSLIPDEVVIEKWQSGYPSGSWVVAKTVSNPDLSREIYITLDSYTPSYTIRFKIKNSTQGGRYQFNWVRGDLASYPGRDFNHIVFKNDRIASVSISKATDLTSQSLPSCDMTVECLDPEGIYSPESSFWGREFSGSQPCLFKAGYEIDGVTEYTPLFFGSLNKEPTYEQGKITFNLSVPMAMSEGVYLGSSYVNGRVINTYPPYSGTLTPGSLITPTEFSSGYYLASLFDELNDIFSDSTDENNSLSNYYFSMDYPNARQLMANALGGYIKPGFAVVELYNACNIQYKPFEDYVTRYDQVKNTLDSQPKVGKIKVTRNENTLSSNYVDIEAVERLTANQNTWVKPVFHLPFWTYGRIELVDAQSSVTGANFSTAWVTRGGNIQKVLDSGDVEYTGFSILCTNTNTTVKPIIRFYPVDTTKYDESESVSNNGTETYENDNEFVTNAYVANKVKRVARMISNMSSQYEVDVVQNIRYELGDIIRLETEKGVYKTCVITALQFKLPGSNGHLTCRKIFSLMDSAYAVPDPQGSLYVHFPTGGDYYVGKNDGVAIFGKFNYNNRTYFYGLGFSTYTKTPGGTEYAVNKKLVDLNGHEWKFFFYNVDNTYTTNDPCVITLPDYDSTSGANANSWGAIELIKALYSEQNMKFAPVDYTCTLENL